MKDIINPGITTGEFSDGSGYAFNLNDPSGVKYLTAEYYRFYKMLLQERGGIPIVNVNDNQLFYELSHHGLVLDERRLTAQKEKSASSAFTVWFHISNACNLSCKYCYIPNIRKATVEDRIKNYVIDADTANIAVKSLFEFCRENGFETLQIKFAGGEPLLAIDIIENTCRYATSLSEQTGINISFRIVTNGVDINNRSVGLFSKFGFGVSISMDGAKLSHDEIRFITTTRTNMGGHEKTNRKGTWDIICRNIDALLGEGIKPYILCTVARNNYKTLEELAAYCRDKVLGFRYSLVRDDSTSTDQYFQAQILSELVGIYKSMGEHMPVTMPIERFARFAEWNLSKKKRKVCGVCRSTICIDNYGDVSTCQMRMEKVYGNVKADGLSLVMEKITTNSFNDLLVHPEKRRKSCQLCEWRFVCAGGCPEHNRKVSGDIDSQSPWCQLYKGLLPIYVEAVARQIKRAVNSG